MHSCHPPARLPPSPTTDLSRRYGPPLSLLTRCSFDRDPDRISILVNVKNNVRIDVFHDERRLREREETEDAHLRSVYHQTVIYVLDT